MFVDHRRILGLGGIMAVFVEIVVLSFCFPLLAIAILIALIVFVVITITSAASVSCCRPFALVIVSCWPCVCSLFQILSISLLSPEETYRETYQPSQLRNSAWPNNFTMDMPHEQVASVQNSLKVLTQSNIKDLLNQIAKLAHR
jgi:hypothetical protein